jgi:hypothetical protein
MHGKGKKERKSVRDDEGYMHSKRDAHYPHHSVDSGREEG